MNGNPGRKDPCPCGSGRKYKNCCWAEHTAHRHDFGRRRLRALEGELVPALYRYAVERCEPRDLKAAARTFAAGLMRGPLPDSDPDYKSIFIPWVASLWEPPELSKEEEPYPRPTVASVYLTRYGQELPGDRIEFIKALILATPSFYQVREVMPDRSILFRDLLAGGEDVEVSEVAGTQGLHPGDVVYTRVLRSSDANIMVGAGSQPFEPNLIGNFQQLREIVRGISKEDGVPIGLAVRLAEASLRRAYFTLRSQVENVGPPKLCNTDGDPLLHCRQTFDLKGRIEAALPLLASLCPAETPETLMQDAEKDKSGAVCRAEVLWIGKAKRNTAGFENTVKGKILLEQGRITVETNSEKRAQTIRKDLEKRLGGDCVFKGMTVETLTPKKFAQGPPRRSSAGDEDLMEHPEVRAQVEKMMQKHWEEWYDTKIPVLGNLTPRKAAKLPEGRERLEALLFDYAQSSKANPKNPMNADIAAIKKELGLP